MNRIYELRIADPSQPWRAIPRQTSCIDRMSTQPTVAPPHFTHDFDGPAHDYLCTMMNELMSPRARAAFEALCCNTAWYPATVVISGIEHDYWVLHLLSEEDGIDFNKSKYNKFKGRVMNFKTLFVKENFIPNCEFFRLSGTSSVFNCLSESGAEKIREANLTGLRLRLIEVAPEDGLATTMHAAVNLTHQAAGAVTRSLPTTPHSQPAPPLSSEETLSQWLAHPQEYGCRPGSLRLFGSYDYTLKHHGKSRLDLFEFVMPASTRGRGVVGPMTWSFMGDEVNALSDEDYLMAYCGWLVVFQALQKGNMKLLAESAGEEALLLEKKSKAGFTDVVILERYEYNGTELFEWRAIHEGEPVRGAGNSSPIDIWNDANSPRYHLPAIYWLFGEVMIQDHAKVSSPA